MSTATDLLLGQGGKPALDLIDPGRGSGCEMNLETGMAGKPVFHLRSLVRTVVVHDQMHAEIGRHSGVAGAQKLEKLGAAMTAVQFADHFAGGDVEGGDQRRRAMAHVVMGAPLRKTRHQRQIGLGAVQRLNLALLTIARMGGSRYKPTMSRTFSTNSGSVESLKVSWRCGYNPKARQMRVTAVCDRPISRAMVRVLQCVVLSAAIPIIGLVDDGAAAPRRSGSCGSRHTASRGKSACVSRLLKFSKYAAHGD